MISTNRFRCIANSTKKKNHSKTATTFRFIGRRQNFSKSKTIEKTNFGKHLILLRHRRQKNNLDFFPLSVSFHSVCLLLAYFFFFAVCSQCLWCVQHIHSHLFFQLRARFTSKKKIYITKSLQSTLNNWHERIISFSLLVSCCVCNALLRNLHAINFFQWLSITFAWQFIVFWRFPATRKTIRPSNNKKMFIRRSNEYSLESSH